MAEIRLSDRYRVLGAAHAMPEFTIADLERYSGVSRDSIRKVLARDQEFFQESGREAALGRGRPAKVYQVVPDKLPILKGELRSLYGDLKEIEGSPTPPQKSGEGIPSAHLSSALHGLLFEYPEAGSRELRTEILQRAERDLKRHSQLATARPDPPRERVVEVLMHLARLGLRWEQAEEKGVMLMWPAERVTGYVSELVELGPTLGEEEAQEIARWLKCRFNRSIAIIGGLPHQAEASGSRFLVPGSPSPQPSVSQGIPSSKSRRRGRIAAADPQVPPRASSRAALSPRPTLKPASSSGPPATLPLGTTDTPGWTGERVAAKLEEIKAGLGWATTTESARKWWQAFEAENRARPGLVLRLAEELVARRATITELFRAYTYSNTGDIQANLHYLDYSRLRKEETKSVAAARASAGPPAIPLAAKALSSYGVEVSETLSSHPVDRSAFPGGWLEYHILPTEIDLVSAEEFDTTVHSVLESVRRVLTKDRVAVTINSLSGPAFGAQLLDTSRDVLSLVACHSRVSGPEVLQWTKRRSSPTHDRIFVLDVDSQASFMAEVLASGAGYIPHAAELDVTCLLKAVPPLEGLKNLSLYSLARAPWDEDED